MTRICGSCSLCCKNMAAPDVKHPHHWCQHARPGKGGCAIYETRPEICRGFLCRWILDETLPDYWFPAHAKIVIDIKDVPERTMVFVVDPDYPGRWRQDPWFSDIKKLAAKGITSGGWVTCILYKDERIPVLG